MTNELSNSDWIYECECEFLSNDVDELERHLLEKHLLPKIEAEG